MEMYSLTRENLEGHADAAKVCVMSALVDEGILEVDFADKWCSEHTVVLRKKRVFRTISDVFSKKKESDGLIFIVVKDVSGKE